MPSIDYKLTMTSAQLATLTALVEKIYPDSEWGPGAAELDVAHDIIRHLDSPFGRGEDSYGGAPFDPHAEPSMGWQCTQSRLEALLSGLTSLDNCSRSARGVPFADLPYIEQNAAIGQLEQGSFAGYEGAQARQFFNLLLDEVFTALFVTPALGQYGLSAVWKRLLRPIESTGEPFGGVRPLNPSSTILGDGNGK